MRLAPLVLLAGCSGTLEFDLEVCHPTGPDGADECVDHGTIVSPFTGDQLSEENALGVHLCSPSDLDVAVERDGEPFSPEEVATSSLEGCPTYVTLAWHRKLPFGTYRVFAKPSTDDQPVSVSETASNASLPEGADLVLTGRAEVATLIVSKPE